MDEGLREVLEAVKRLLIAFGLGLPVGWEREALHRTPGLRTFPLVAMGSCGFMLIGITAFETHPDAQARVIQGLLSGIGFIGGGAILKGVHDVAGVSTAVSIWITAAIGVSVAYDHYTVAITLSLTTLITLHLMRTKKDRAAREDAAEDRARELEAEAQEKAKEKPENR